MAQKRKSKMVHAHTIYDKGGGVRAMILWKRIKLSQHSHTHKKNQFQVYCRSQCEGTFFIMHNNLYNVASRIYNSNKLLTENL